MFHAGAYHRSVPNKEPLLLKVAFFYSKDSGVSRNGSVVKEKKKNLGKQPMGAMQ